ncbi:MAG: RNA-directed DNA polymerase, partial [bacterium]
HFAAGIRNYPFILRMDIRKFFPSIDREILKSLFRRVVRCRRTLALMDLFVDTSNAQEPVGWHFFGDDLWTPCEHPHGLPLGNQTSQLFANVYLDSLDHFVKEHLRCRHYVRYVDDLALFGSGKPTLGGWKGDIEQFLCGFRLRAHAGKSRVYRSRDGVSFLGLRFRPGTRRLAAENARRARRRVKKQVSMCRRGSLSITDLEKSWAGWRGHAEQANAQGLVEQLWRQAGEWRADGDNDVPGGSGRWLEQSISQHSVRQSEQESTG